MRTLFLALLPCLATALSAQSDAYKSQVAKADSLLHAGQARAAAEAYSAAFETLGWKGRLDDRYAAARAWAKSDMADSAFFQLNRLVEKMQFNDAEKLKAEPDFAPLHADFRWTRLLTQIHMQQERAEARRRDPLVLELEEIHRLDQWYRIKRDSVLAAHGGLRTEGYRKFMRAWIERDSLNAQRISEILDERGWLGPEEVGEYASKAFYLVIQHAPLSLQEKYFPLMQQAAKAGKAVPADLAYLEDRILMRQGKPQRYGSQFRTDEKTGAWVLHELEDPANVDARRASVGLGPLAEYLEMMGVKWTKP